ncbi:MAG: hypothetical protein KatS3mg111_1373 [Pirellulaceae bacterium]|nr:MAG: hypothetical protein KatS3mg111_1373 [Pirellulaceae bacterium]
MAEVLNDHAQLRCFPTASCHAETIGGSAAWPDLPPKEIGGGENHTPISETMLDAYCCSPRAQNEAPFLFAEHRQRDRKGMRGAHLD